VPLHGAEAAALVESILPFLEWQTTIEYLKDPPDGYLEPATDILGLLGEIAKKIAFEEYRSEYEFQVELYEAFNTAHDGHLRFIGDALGKAFGFARRIALASVSSDGQELPKIYVHSESP
jgi:hypothetical protein